MSVNERRQALLMELFSRRQDTSRNLAKKFNVTLRTIHTDIEQLSCSYPIEVIRGRHGGVKVSDWFYPDSKHLSAEQFSTLTKLRDKLDGKDRIVLNSILVQFAP